MSFLVSFLVIIALLVFTTTVPSLAIFLMLVFFVTAAFFLYKLGLTFLSLMVLIVYVGAIAMLFVFCTMLFERNTPLRGYFLYRSFFVSISVSIISSLLIYFGPIFFNKSSTQLHNNDGIPVVVWYEGVWNNDTINYPVKFDHLDFLEVFSSFFFTTNLGLIYLTLIGFLLFFFTIAVTYIFFFTKKL